MRKEKEISPENRTIWKIAEELRGNIDGWNFRPYVIDCIFYRYLSEYITSYINHQEHERENFYFDYETLDDENAENFKKSLLKDIGLFLRPSQLFSNVMKTIDNNADLAATMTALFHSLDNPDTETTSPYEFKGIMSDVNFNSNQLGITRDDRNARIAHILQSIGSMQLGSLDDNPDKYAETFLFLMTMYGSDIKEGSEYFTPVEVSELLARIALRGRTHIDRLYDPACGTGSLLLQASRLLGNRNIKSGIYGQENNPTSFNLCRINMLLNRINHRRFHIACGDTLLNPAFMDKRPFDAIISNPPYSIPWASKRNKALAKDDRFMPAGILPPQSKADLAFTLHILYYLANQGTAAIVQFPGILYRTGKEQNIRKYLVDNNLIDAIIQLPANLFFGVSISTCIVILRKGKAEKDILFYDASREYVHRNTKSTLSEENIQSIYDTYINRKEEKHVSRLALPEEIASNNYNLSVSTYVEAPIKSDSIDIVKLNKEIDHVMAQENALRKQIDTFIASWEGDRRE